jgi:hypothetical protein
MRNDMMKATVGGAWLIGLGALALSDIVTANGSGRALVLGFGVVPVAIMWMLWNPVEPTLSAAIHKARH